MTIDEPKIKRFIHKILESEGTLGSTALHRQVYDMGKDAKGRNEFGETAIWKVILKMEEIGELTSEILPNKRKNYSLTDITQEVSRVLDSLFKDLDEIEERLTKFHKKYFNPKNQTEANYMTRLDDLTTIAKMLLRKQSYLILTNNLIQFKKHKSKKSLDKRIDDLWDSIRHNAYHQLNKKSSKFFQELIFSVQGYEVQTPTKSKLTFE